MSTISKLHKAFNIFVKQGLSMFFYQLTHDNRSYVIDNYNEWFKSQTIVSHQDNFVFRPLISVVVPTFNTPKKFLIEMIESVINQDYPNWELCIADGSDTDEVIKVINTYEDSRIKIKKLNKNLGIVGNTNAALEMVNGDYITLFDHDDLLTPDALSCFVEHLQEIKYDVLYSDEDLVTEDSSTFIGPNFKPDWSPDLFNSHNYITHLFMAKSEIVNAVGGFRSEFEGAQDYDFIARCIDESNSICHVPKILYHWRAHAASTAGDSTSKLYAYENGKKVIKEHLAKQNIKADVDMITNILGFYHVKYNIDRKPLVSIVSDNKSLKKQLTYAKSEIVNSVEFANGEYCLFVNKNLKPLSDDCLQDMLGICMRKDVGAVAGKILYKNQYVQHAGLILDKKNFARFVFQNCKKDDHGYMSRPFLTCNYSAVMCDCFMIKTDLYKQLDTNKYRSKVNDVDICLQILDKGFVIVCDGHAVWSSNNLLYKECFDSQEVAICLKDHEDLFNQSDRYYNINFNIDKELFQL